MCWKLTLIYEIMYRVYLYYLYVGFGEQNNFCHLIYMLLEWQSFSIKYEVSDNYWNVTNPVSERYNAQAAVS